jgi:hypothetical protein
MAILEMKEMGYFTFFLERFSYPAKGTKAYPTLLLL